MEQQFEAKCIFGPVPSRRLGLSLGLNILTYKTCSLDCVYCECGATTNLTVAREEYIPLHTILAELDAALEKEPLTDYVTFSGVGEPTLNRNIGGIISHIKQNHPEKKVCLLTNGTTLINPDVRRETAAVDLIIPSFDASTDAELAAINRPAPGITVNSIFRGIQAFRRESKAAMWLEIFIVAGINDSDASAVRFRDFAAAIAPDKVQLNTLDRPGAESWVVPAPDSTLERIAGIIGGAAPVEKIKPRSKNRSNNATDDDAVNERIFSTVKARPCTAPDIAAMTGMPVADIEKRLAGLVEKGVLRTRTGERGVFYSPA